MRFSIADKIGLRGDFLSPAQGKEANVKTRGLGRSIMAGGVLCLIIYALLAMRGNDPLNVRVGGILFYVGVVAIPLGVILLWTGEMKRPPGKWRKAGRNG